MCHYYHFGPSRQNPSRLFPSCLCSAAQRNVDTTLQQLTAGSTTPPVKTFYLRVGGHGSRGRTACPPCQCVLRVLALDLRTSSNLQSMPPHPGFFRRISAVMFSTAQPQLGLATSTGCWSGFMKPREEQRVFATSPRRSTEDPCPTSPTCWLDFLRVGRRCSSQILCWSTKIRFQSPPIVRLRTSW